MLRSMKLDSLEFRRTCGQFATGVTVVTVHNEGRTYGMTANSFVSASLDPPLVLVSVDNHSRMNKVLAGAPRYGVSVLAEHQEDLSAHFAGKSLRDREVSFTFRDGVPLLDKAVAHFIVLVTDTHPAGDHTLYIGRVEFMASHGGRPLLFHTGKYRRLHREETPVLRITEQTVTARIA